MLAHVPLPPRYRTVYLYRPIYRAHDNRATHTAVRDVAARTLSLKCSLPNLRSQPYPLAKYTILASTSTQSVQVPEGRSRIAGQVLSRLQTFGVCWEGRVPTEQPKVP